MNYKFTNARLQRRLNAVLFVFLFIFMLEGQQVFGQRILESFTTAGTTTWTCPAGITSIQVECWGAGGGGAGASSSTNLYAGGGGAGGNYAKNALVTVVPGTTYTIVVGAGGTAGSTNSTTGFGGCGGTSSFGSALYASGGTGGAGGGSSNKSGVGGSNGGIWYTSLVAAGSGYATAPTVVVGTAWTAGATYTLNQQVFNAGNLYTVTTLGTSGTTAPIHTSGMVPATGGTAVLAYAGVAATGTAGTSGTAPALSLSYVSITNPGSGYLVAPTLTIVGAATTSASATATINPINVTGATTYFIGGKGSAGSAYVAFNTNLTSGAGGGSAGTSSNGNNAILTAGGIAVTGGGAGASGANGSAMIGATATELGGGGGGATGVSKTGGVGAAGKVVISDLSSLPSLKIIPSSLTDFAATKIAPSEPQTLTVNGTNLTAGVLLFASANYEINNPIVDALFSSTVALSPTSGTLAATPILVRLKSGLNSGINTGTVTASSAAAINATITCNGVVKVTYYYKGAGALADTSSWASNANGSGVGPSNFSNDGQIFQIINTTTIATDKIWSISGAGSKLVVGDSTAAGVTLTIENGFPIKTISPAVLDMMSAKTGANKLVIKDTSAALSFGLLNATSEVHYQASVTTPTNATFGKLFIDGGTGKTVTINGNPAIAENGSLTLAENDTLSIGGLSFMQIKTGATLTLNGTVRSTKAAGLINFNVATPSVTFGSLQFFDAYNSVKPNFILGAKSTFEYTRSTAGSSQIISALPIGYANLTLSDGGTGTCPKTFAAGNYSVAGTLSINHAGGSSVTLSPTTPITINPSGTLELKAGTLIGSKNVNLSSGSTIIRYKGILDEAPVFNTAINVIYSGETLAISGFELPKSTSILNNLTINNTGGVLLDSAKTVNGTLTLINGILTIPATGTLRIASGNAIAGAPFSNLKYIKCDSVLNSLGKLLVSNMAPGVEIILPIGNARNYLPVTFKPTTESDFSVSVFEGVTDNGQPAPIGKALPIPQKGGIVDAVWAINRTAGAGNCEVSLNWAPSLEGIFFNTFSVSEIGIVSTVANTWGIPVGSFDRASNTAKATLNSFGYFSAGAKLKPFNFYPPVKTYGDSLDFDGGAVSFNTTKPIIYSSKTPSVATVINNKIHIVSAGIAYIVAAQETDGIFADTSIERPMTVNKAMLTVTAINKAKVQGSANPPLEFTLNGFVLNETKSVLASPVVITTTAKDTSSVGVYPITFGSLTDANYTFSFVNGLLTVLPKTAQTITFGALPAKVYGNAAFPVMATSTNSSIKITYASSNNNVATVTTVNGNDSIHIVNAGTAVITASQKSDSIYLAAVDVAQPIVINKASLTITAVDTSKIQGAADPIFNFNYNGFVLGETVANLTNLPTVLSFPNAAGVYSLVPQGAASANYSFKYVNGKIIVYPPTGKDTTYVSAFISSSNTLTVRVYAVHPALADIKILDFNGRLVAKKNLFMPIGYNQAQFDLGVLPSGIYFVVIKGNGVDLTRKISIIR